MKTIFNHCIIFIRELRKTLHCFLVLRMQQADITKDKFIDTVKDRIGQQELESLRQLKPYYCIMRVLLVLWSTDRRNLAESELQKLRHSQSGSAVDVHEFTWLLWHELHVKTYYDYVGRHKFYVKRCYQIFNSTIVTRVKPVLLSEGRLSKEIEPTRDPTDQQIDCHDDSKYSFEETVTYAQRWFPDECLGPSDEQAWQRGLWRHYCSNEHHPQFWRGRAMAWRNLVEAVYDMAAMELERRFAGAVPDDVSRLLEFELVHLERFRDTGQYELMQRLLVITIEQVRLAN